MRKFQEIKIDAPDYDHDVVITYPSGKQVVIQARPSNADIRYNGSLDIILPDDTLVTCWQGDDMADAPAPNPERQHERVAKQLVCELPACDKME